LTVSIQAKNQAQKTADISFSGNRTDVGTTPVVIYTCPTGQKARVTTFLWRPNGFGSGTEVFANVAGLRMDAETVIQTVFRSVLQGSDVGIEAGDTITLSGDGGSNNSTVLFFVTVLESPA